MQLGQPKNVVKVTQVFLQCTYTLILDCVFTLMLTQHCGAESTYVGLLLTMHIGLLTHFLTCVKWTVFRYSANHLIILSVASQLGAA